MIVKRGNCRKVFPYERHAQHVCACIGGKHELAELPQFAMRKGDLRDFCPCSSTAGRRASPQSGAWWFCDACWINVLKNAAAHHAPAAARRAGVLRATPRPGQWSSDGGVCDHDFLGCGRRRDHRADVLDRRAEVGRAALLGRFSREGLRGQRGGSGGKQAGC